MAASKAFDILLGLKDKMSAGLNQANANLNKFANKIEEVNKRMNRASNWGKTFGKGLTNVGEKMEMFGQRMTTMVTLPIVGAFALATKGMMDFQDGLSGVEETTGISGTALDALGDSVHALAKRIPVATDELLKIMAEAGQMGVRTPEDLLKVTEVMAKFSRTTGIAGDVATDTLTKILTLSNEPISNIDKLASAFTSLADNFKAPEKEIAKFTLLVSQGVGTKFNIGSSNVVALGTALAGMGTKAKGASSGVKTSFQTIDKIIRTGKTKQIAELLRLTGLSFKDLKTQFKTDSFSVFEKFVEGLSRAKKRGDDLNDSFAKLGLKADGVSDLATHFDDLTKAMKLSGAQYENAIALNDEFAIRQKNLRERIQAIKNKFADFGDKIATYLIPILEDKLIPALDKMFDYFDKHPELAKTIVQIGLFAAILGPVIYVIGLFLTGIGKVISFFGYFASAIKIVWPYLVQFGGWLTDLVGSSTLAQGALGAVLSAIAFLASYNFSDFVIGDVMKSLAGDTTSLGFSIQRDLRNAITKAQEFIFSKMVLIKKSITDAWAFINSATDKELFGDGAVKSFQKIQSAAKTAIDKIIQDFSRLGPALTAAVLAGIPGWGLLVQGFQALTGGPAAAPAAGGGGAATGGGGGGVAGSTAMRTPTLGPERSFAGNNVSKSTQTNDSKVTVDFKNMPRGTAVTPQSNGGKLDVNLGYATA